MTDAIELLDTIEIRLRETMQVFAAHETLNRMASAHDALRAMLNSNFSFWHACALSFDAHVILGLAALTEPHRASATFQRVIDLLTKRRGTGAVPSEIRVAVSGIHARYKRYRDKLVSHNDEDRERIAAEFSALGLTWDSIRDDIQQLVQSLNALRQINAGLPIADARMATEERTLAEFLAMQTAKDTEQVLLSLIPLGDGIRKQAEP